VPPIRNRIDMLATGIKSPIGVKVSAGSLEAIDRATQQIEQIAQSVPGVSSALAERLTGGRYIDVDIDRVAAARYGLNIGDVQSVVASAIGGEDVGETIEGRARYPISMRYAREWRDSIQALTNLPILTAAGSQITLGTVAAVQVADGPSMLKSENARASGWVYIDVRGRDLSSTVADLRRAVAQRLKAEPGLSVTYSGQFEYLERATARLELVVPGTLLIIFLLLYLAFHKIEEALLIMLTLPFALTGGVWFLYWMGYNLSIATGVGFIALAGVAAEFGVIMLLYLRNAWTASVADGHCDAAALLEAIRHGAVQRVRPKAMTVSVIIAGLLPIFWGNGTGSEIMSRIAAPMVGGMITAPLLSLLVIPAAYMLLRRPRISNNGADCVRDASRL
jgi:Cu(I)/Ag(I) efflux system membrane protein CusA/SilA